MNEFVVWLWDPDKDEANRRRHGVAFQAAVQAFDDPFSATVEDPHLFEERWRTLGMVGFLLALVVHTAPELDEQMDLLVGRIISARPANTHERRAYEEGLQ